LPKRPGAHIGKAIPAYYAQLCIHCFKMALQNGIVASRENKN
jgi:hypothetical protein